MEEGVKHLIGKHDFTSFRTINCQAKSPIRTLDKISGQIIYKSDFANLWAQLDHVKTGPALRNSLPRRRRSLTLLLKVKKKSRFRRTDP